MPLLLVQLLLFVGKTGDVNNMGHNSMLHFLDVAAVCDLQIQSPGTNFAARLIWVLSYYPN